MKNILIIISILLIGAFISQSIYWISLGSQKQFIYYENKKLLCVSKLVNITYEYDLHNIHYCTDYYQGDRVTFTRARGLFPFYKDTELKTIFYPIILDDN